MSDVVAIQGEEGSFHAIAAHQFFVGNIKLAPRETFAETFQAVTTGQAQQAVVALENSLYGSINEVYDLLLKHKLWISGEVYLRIKQCLVGLPGTKLSDIKEVHSHPIALAQCEDYLDAALPDAGRFENHDTAGSALDIKTWQDPAKAAIASKEAAELHGLDVLADSIETNKANYTRFVVLSPEKTIQQGANKTSLVMVTADRPGALYHALGVFANKGINLTKLQSRPIVGQAWRYMFYVDVAGHAEQEPLASALGKLQEQDCEATVLGSYKAHQST